MPGKYAAVIGKIPVALLVGGSAAVDADFDCANPAPPAYRAACNVVTWLCPERRHSDIVTVNANAS
jgi:hypothetical protein